MRLSLECFFCADFLVTITSAQICSKVNKANALSNRWSRPRLLCLRRTHLYLALVPVPLAFPFPLRAPHLSPRPHRRPRPCPKPSPSVRAEFGVCCCGYQSEEGPDGRECGGHLCLRCAWMGAVCVWMWMDISSGICVCASAIKSPRCEYESGANI